MLEEMIVGSDAPLSLTSLSINLGIGVILGLILSYHFTRFGSTLSNRTGFAAVFPLILLTTVLVISIVKSSLALSLGLVGALSIVRFRTPIKEPEELAYLFLAIAMGLGLGADQTIPTIIASILILAVMAVRSMTRKTESGKGLYLSIDLETEADNEEATQGALTELNGLISQHGLSSDLRRFDVRDNLVAATYFLNVASPEDLSGLSNQLRSKFPNIGLTFIDQNNLPSV